MKITFQISLNMYNKLRFRLNFYGIVSKVHRLHCIGLLNMIMLYTFVISLHKQFGNKVTY